MSPPFVEQDDTQAVRPGRGRVDDRSGARGVEDGLGDAQILARALTMGSASPQTTRLRCSICCASGSSRVISATLIWSGFHHDRPPVLAWVFMPIVGIETKSVAW
jgi:hypothetical protein